MELFSANYEENTRALDDLLGVGRCFDMISRDLYVGGRRARLWVVDGYGDDAVIERMLSFWLPLRGRRRRADDAAVHRPIHHIQRGKRRAKLSKTR